MAGEQVADQVRGEVSPGGTGGGRRPTGVPPGEVAARPLAQGLGPTAHGSRSLPLGLKRRWATSGNFAPLGPGRVDRTRKVRLKFV
jgi:hypothetical protein